VVARSALRDLVEGARVYSSRVSVSVRSAELNVRVLSRVELVTSQAG